jgi:hypothetical protein
MNTRLKMYETNSFIKKELIKQGFHNLYLFPHLRFIKDYIFEDVGFDAIGWKADDKRIYLMQFKTNEKPSKKMLEKFKAINEKYSCVCLWATKIKKNGVQIFY